MKQRQGGSGCYGDSTSSLTFGIFLSVGCNNIVTIVNKIPLATCSNQIIAIGLQLKLAPKTLFTKIMNSINLKFFASNALFKFKRFRSLSYVWNV